MKTRRTVVQERRGATVVARAAQGFWRWLDERLGLQSLAYPVPAHANAIPYMLGGIISFGLVVLVVTGIYLAQFYNPAPAGARDSVLHIIDEAWLGDFVRSVHFWTANLIVVTMLLHIIRVFATGAHRPPRELNWLVGLGLVAVILGSVFTGTVLKWDQEGWEALQHSEEVGGLLGGLGGWLTSDFTKSVPLLTRLYVAHIAILPLILIVLLTSHFWLIRRHGISSLPGRDENRQPELTDTEAAIAREGATPFTHHLRRLAGYGILLTVVAGALALAVPAPLGQVIEPGEEVTKPPWMFLPFYPLEDWWGIRALVIVPPVLFALLALVPFLDRGISTAMRRRWQILIAGAIVVAALVGLGIYAALTGPQAHVMEG